MTTPVKEIARPISKAGKPPLLIVYGRDADRRPHAGCFTAKEAEPAKAAATAARLTYVEASTEQLAKLAGSLPMGKQGAGTTVVPIIGVTLYERLLNAVGAASAATKAGPPPPRPQNWDS